MLRVPSHPTIALAALFLMGPAVVHAQPAGLGEAAPGAPETPAAPAAPAAEAPSPAPSSESGGGSTGASGAGEAEAVEEVDKAVVADGDQPLRKLPKELWNEDQQAAYQRTVESSEDSVVQIVSRPVSGASSFAETSLSAPAWVITISREEILERGYTELSEVLDDLPSMDIIRPHGDTYVKNYWRGYRNNIGSPYLLMVDGLIYNQLWINETAIMSTFPLSNIERIEVVYGPASAVYGNNAAMGVINIVTIRDAKQAGVNVDSRLTLGTSKEFSFGDMTKIADGRMLYKGDGYRVTGTLRFEFGTLDPTIGENFEWTKEKYYRDEALWGDFADQNGIGNGFKSPDEKQAVDLRLLLGEHPACGQIADPRKKRRKGREQRCTEMAAQHYKLTTGYGTVYPADKAQTAAPWTYLEQSASIRHTQQLSAKLNSQTVLRYRISNVDQPSFFAYRLDSGDVELSYWQSTNNSWTAKQDFTIRAGKQLIFRDDWLDVAFGLKYEHRDLDRAYVNSLGNFPIDDSAGRAYPGGAGTGYPDPTSDALFVDNRTALDNAGFYSLLKYKVLSRKALSHSLHAGVRLDYSELLKTVQPIFRFGYVGQPMKDLTAKILYGQAFQEPNFRELFGVLNDGSGISASNANLQSERSNTVELSLDYTQKWLGARAGGYLVRYSDPMVSDGSNTPTNVAKRDVAGLDISAQTLIALGRKNTLKNWVYYSPILQAEQTAAGDEGGTEAVGDIAAHKVLGGMTFRYAKIFSATMMGRWIGDRNTVSTNPIPTIPSYFTLDFFTRVRFNHGVWLGLRGTNILDTNYAHPGIRGADSGSTPGVWEGGSWAGSDGVYNSRLPQPGREIWLTLGIGE